MNISESGDINTLLSYVLGVREAFGNRSDAQASEAAQKAASRLADRATRRRMRGLTGDQVAELWSGVEACPWRDGGR
jgi:hypothetical protein